MKLTVDCFNWGDYPDWVNYVAVDKNGEVYGYFHKPDCKKDDGIWECRHDYCMIYLCSVSNFKHVYIGNWKELIFERP